MKQIKKIIKPETILSYVFLTLTVLGFLFAMMLIFVGIPHMGFIPEIENQFANPKLVNILLVCPFILFLTPYLFINLFALKKVESKLEVIPRFLRDIVDNVESGMDMISSIKSTSNNEYGVLNVDIEKFANQLSWGVDFNVALLNFADNIGASSLKRDFLLIIEAKKVGGHIEKLLRELSQKINNEILRTKERKSNLASNTFTGYISFMIFIMIIILVYNNLFLGIGANFADSSSSQSTYGATASVDNVVEETSNGDGTEQYLTLFMLLSYELAILSGFLFGLMQNNNIVSGAPHVVMLIVLTFIGFFFFI